MTTYHCMEEGEQYGLPPTGRTFSVEAETLDEAAQALWKHLYPGVRGRCRKIAEARDWALYRPARWVNRYADHWAGNTWKVSWTD